MSDLLEGVDELEDDDAGLCEKCGGSRTADHSAGDEHYLQCFDCGHITL